MTGLELSRARGRLGLSIMEFGQALGIEGERANIKSKVHKWEYGQAPVPAWVVERVGVLMREEGL